MDPLQWNTNKMCVCVATGATLLVAVRAVAAGARSTGLGFLEYVRSGRDPVSVAIMAEVHFPSSSCHTHLQTVVHALILCLATVVRVLRLRRWLAVV